MKLGGLGDRCFSYLILLTFFVLLACGYGLTDAASLSYARADDSHHTDSRLQFIEKTVIRIVADYFGVPESKLTPATHLVNDLYADQMDVYEIISRALGANSREAKQIPGDRLTISEIAAFIDQADYKVFHMTYRGGTEGDKSGGGQPRESAEDVYYQKIFFASNREPTGKKLPDSVFSGDRSKSREMHYGTCLISIPKKHVKGKLEVPMNFGFYRQEAVPSEHFLLKNLEMVSWDHFLAGINSDLKQLSRDDITAQDILIFVHGFNVSFNQAALRTGQVAFDLRFQGAPILFSWPSRSGILSYVSDREAVEWSVVYIEKFLTDIIENTHARKYHLIAHSMGNQGVIPALYQMALRGKFKGKAVFGNIILAAPDFDARKFTEQVAPEVKSLAERWTIYASDKDAALKASKLLRLDTSQRLGQPLAVVDGMDTVDASGFEVTPWNLSENHSYFSTKLRVIKDVRAVLRGLAPKARELLRKLSGSQVYWQIMQD
jgi:esterase/lipase superfamily enzyme